jgi:phosphatidate cytidylyltransferase
VLARVLSGITFVPVLILAARAGGAWFLLLVNWILAAATWEFYGLMEAKGVHPSKKVGIFASLALAVVVYTTGLEHLGLFLSAFVLTILVRELFRAKLAFPIYDIATTVFGVVYVGWLLTHLILIRELPRSIGLPDLLGAHLVLYSILIVWSCDTGAFLFGILFGRHKLLPHVSPENRWRGPRPDSCARWAGPFGGGPGSRTTRTGRRSSRWGRRSSWGASSGSPGSWGISWSRSSSGTRG